MIFINTKPSVLLLGFLFLGTRGLGLLVLLAPHASRRALVVRVLVVLVSLVSVVAILVIASACTSVISVIAIVAIVVAALAVPVVGSVIVTAPSIIEVPVPKIVPLLVAVLAPALLPALLVAGIHINSDNLIVELGLRNVLD